ncbi:MAG: hypothetical protein ACYDAP_09390 [Thermoplasmataceae archaeon]
MYFSEHTVGNAWSLTKNSGSVHLLTLTNAIRYLDIFSDLFLEKIVDISLLQFDYKRSRPISPLQDLLIPSQLSGNSTLMFIKTVHLNTAR